MAVVAALMTEDLFGPSGASEPTGPAGPPGPPGWSGPAGALPQQDVPAADGASGAVQAGRRKKGSLQEKTPQAQVNQGLDAPENISSAGALHAVGAPQLGSVVAPLLKLVLYRLDDPALWTALIDLQARVRDYVAVLNLDLILDESEGYAFLKARPDPQDESAPRPPRLVVRRPLSFQMSLLLALLRKKLVEFDASGADTRLVLSLEQVVELVRVFSASHSNEARLMDQVQAQLNKLVELGFVRKLKSADARQATPDYEVQRILKAFVDAQWLADLDARLAAYQAHLGQADESGDAA